MMIARADLHGLHTHHSIIRSLLGPPQMCWRRWGSRALVCMLVHLQPRQCILII